MRMVAENLCINRPFFQRDILHHYFGISLRVFLVIPLVISTETQLKIGSELICILSNPSGIPFIFSTILNSFSVSYYIPLNISLICFRQLGYEFIKNVDKKDLFF